MMGEALIAGLLRDGGIVRADHITIAEPVAARRQVLERSHGVKTTASNLAAVEEADCVILAVKPQIFPDVATELRGRLRPEQLLITIMAGVPLVRVVEGTEHPQSVRVMPNVMCRVGQGVLVWKA